MDIDETSPTRAGEWEVDFSIVQLLETSADFRRWFIGEVAPEHEIEVYIGGVIHTSYAGEGESDIEFGYQAPSRECHVVLIENKINASLQPEQVERYYRRGQFRVDRGNWESYTVCLMAPERYVSEENRDEFEAVLTYEAILDYLAELPHDSAGFLRAVIESTEKKSITPDATGVLQSMADEFRRRTELADLHQSVDYKKRRAFRSGHPQHPDEVQYDVYIGETGDSGRSNVRLQILDTETLTSEKREAIESLVSQHIDSLPEYELELHRGKNIAHKRIWHDEVVQETPHESYQVAIADELQTLTDTFHPKFVDSS